MPRIPCIPICSNAIKLRRFNGELSHPGLVLTLLMLPQQQSRLKSVRRVRDEDLVSSQSKRRVGCTKAALETSASQRPGKCPCVSNTAATLLRGPLVSAFSASHPSLLVHTRDWFLEGWKSKAGSLKSTITRLSSHRMLGRSSTSSRGLSSDDLDKRTAIQCVCRRAHLRTQGRGRSEAGGHLASGWP